MLIGEVAQRSGISARMLRHYDRIGLVCPTERTVGGYREYAEDDMRRLFHVEGLRSLGLSLAQIAEVIDDRDFDPAVMVDTIITRTREQIAQGQELVSRLEGVRATDPRTWSDVLRTIGLVRGLEASTPSHRQELALTVAGADRRDAPVLVEAMLREPSDDAAGALQWAIARAGDAAVPALAAALESADPDRRRRALDALVKLDSAAARAAIVACIAHDDLRIRNRAILTRARHGGHECIPDLVELVSMGQDDVEAADVLTDLALREGHLEQVMSAMSASFASAEPPARRRLVAALADLPIHATTDLLTVLRADDDRATALTATLILQKRAPEASVP